MPRIQCYQWYFRICPLRKVRFYGHHAGNSKFHDSKLESVSDYNSSSQMIDIHKHKFFHHRIWNHKAAAKNLYRFSLWIELHESSFSTFAGEGPIIQQSRAGAFKWKSFHEVSTIEFRLKFWTFFPLNSVRWDICSCVVDPAWLIFVSCNLRHWFFIGAVWCLSIGATCWSVADKAPRDITSAIICSTTSDRIFASSLRSFSNNSVWSEINYEKYATSVDRTRGLQIFSLTLSQLS